MRRTNSLRLSFKAVGSFARILKLGYRLARIYIPFLLLVRAVTPPDITRPGSPEIFGTLKDLCYRWSMGRWTSLQTT